MYNYIPHPSNCRVSSSLLSLLVREGAAGYGVYWMLLEVLRDAPDYRVEYDREVLSYSLHLDDVILLGRVCEQYKLFDIDNDGYLSSPWLCQQMEAYDERKKKLQEAGRRGAAKRFAPAASEDGKAIATPSVEDGKAIAYNVTKHNITRHDITQPTQALAEDWREICRNQGTSIDPIELEEVAKSQVPGHARGYIMQVCLQYGMGKNVFSALCGITNDADVSHPTYKKFVTIVKRIQTEKYRPEYPANFFFSKILG